MCKGKLFHDWGSWEDTKLTLLTSTNSLTLVQTVFPPNTEIDGQRRVCKQCGKRQLRQV